MGAYVARVGGVVGERGGVGAWLVAWQGVGLGAVGRGGAINEGGVEALDVSTIAHGDVHGTAGVDL